MKNFIILCFLVLTSSCEFNKSFSSSFAKEYCSCRFVVGQSKAHCKEYAQNYLPPWTIIEDIEKKIVTVRNMFKTTTATYINKRFGCIIKN